MTQPTLVIGHYRDPIRLLRLGHAGARAAERAARPGVVDPRAEADARAAHRRDRRVRGRVLQAGARVWDLRRSGSGAARGSRSRRPVRLVAAPGAVARFRPRVAPQGAEGEAAAGAGRAGARPVPRSSGRSSSAMEPVGCSPSPRSSSSCSSPPAGTTAAATREAAEVFPDGGSFPEQKIFDVGPAPRAPAAR